jgi:hypothetical protein
MLEGAKMEASQRVCGVRVKALACGLQVKSPKKLEIEVMWSHPPFAVARSLARQTTRPMIRYNTPRIFRSH